MLGIAAGVGLILWVSAQEIDIAAPTALEGLDDGRMAIATRKDLLIADRNGALLESIPLSSLGLSEIASDMQLLPDGGLLLAEAGDGVVHRCNLAAMKCKPFIHPSGVNSDIEANSVKLAFDKARETVYLANSWKQRIEKYDLDGKYQSEVAVDSRGVLYPNDMWALEDGRLVISDTNHRRFVVSSSSIQEGSVQSDGVEGFTVECFPMGVIKRGDELWTIEGGNMFTSNWVTRYDLHGNKIQEIELSSGNDPVVFEPFGEAVLVAVQNPARIAMISPDGRDTGNFEGEGLVEYFTAVREKQHALESMQFGGWGVLAVSGVLALFVLYLERTEKGRKRPAQSMSGFPDNEETTMQELEVTFGRAATVWWAWTWRIMIYLLLFSIIVGVVLGIAVGVVVASLGVDQAEMKVWMPAIMGVSGLFGMVVSIWTQIWVMSKVLKKRFSDYRIALIRN